MVSILRKQLPRSNYTVLDNGLLRDRRLSWAARGMLAFLLSKPDGWEVREANLINESDAPRQGIRSVRAMLAELEDAGYLHRDWENDERGRLRRVTSVADHPAFAKDEPTESTDVRSTDIGSADIGRTHAIVSTDPNEVPSLRTPPATPPPPSAEPEPAAGHYGDLFVAVRDACRFDAKVISPRVARNVADAAKRLAKAEVQPADVAAAAARWYAEDWRGKQGQAPTVAQFEDWISTCRTAAPIPPRPGTQPAVPTWKPASPERMAAARARVAADAEAYRAKWGIVEVAP